MGATGETKFVRTLHDIIFIEITHVFPSCHDVAEYGQQDK